VAINLRLNQKIQNFGGNLKDWVNPFHVRL
jgi:hypothetical protein